MKNDYNEREFEENIIKLLEEQNFQYYNYEKMKDLRIDSDGFFDKKEVLLWNVIQDSIKKINKNISENNVNNIINKLKNCFNTTNLFEANKNANNILKNGITITDERLKKTSNFKIVDFKNIDNNSFIVTNQFSIININNEKRIPDILIYLNGFPIIVFELKTPQYNSSILESSSLSNAFQQINNYKKQIPDLFVFNFFNVITNMTITKFGSTFNNLDRFNYWRSEKNSTIDDFIENLFNKKTLLDLFKNYSFFTNEETNPQKIIAAHHQYYGVKKALNKISKAIENNTKKGGLFWHTQGSGKSLSMVFLTKNFIKKHPQSSIVVISDRNDLDDQTFKTFSKANNYLFQEPTKIDSILDLKNKLENIKQDGIYFSTIQKFVFEKISTLSDRENILVISDEAHRSHNNLNYKYVIDEKTNDFKKNKGYALVLREAFPNAVFTGFTGTPIESDDVSTQKIFGKISTKYTMKDAENDNFIVPINYEVRHKHLKITSDSAKKLDKYYDILIEEIDKSSDIKNLARKKVNKEIQQIEKIILHPDRMKEIAEDFIKHYKSRSHILKGKVMFVAYNRKIGYEYWKLFTSISPDLKKNIKFIATTNSSDPAEMIELIGNKKEQKIYANEFKDPNSDFKIAIVVDMWLTGFDVPSLDTLYIDKPLKMHNLMQAVARVNRVFSDQITNNNVLEQKTKNSGLIVDYFGIYKHLIKALKFYNNSESIENNQEKAEYQNIEDIQRDFLDSLELIKKEYFENEELFLNKNIIEKTRELTNLIYEKKQQKNYVTDFKKIKLEYNSIAQNLNNDNTKMFYLFKHVYDTLINQEIDNITDIYFLKIKKLKEMIVESIIFEDSSELSELSTGKKISLNDLLKQTNEITFEKETKYLNAKEKENHIKILISKISNTDKLKSEQLSSKLKILLNKYEQSFISFEEFINGLDDIVKDIEKGINDDQDLKLNEEEIIFYKLIQPDSKELSISKDKEIAIKIAKEVYETFQSKINIDSKIKWHENNVRKRNIRKEIKELMKKYDFPPEDRNLASEVYVDRIIKNEIERSS